MKITDLMIDPRSLGDKLWLVDVSPAYEYKDNRRTDTILGYRYAVAMPEKGLDKINVRIDGKQLMEARTAMWRCASTTWRCLSIGARASPRWEPRPRASIW